MQNKYDNYGRYSPVYNDRMALLFGLILLRAAQYYVTQVASGELKKNMAQKRRYTKIVTYEVNVLVLTPTLW